MVVLRSREILPTKQPLTKQPTPEPLTPAQAREPTARHSSPSLTANFENQRSASDSASTKRRSVRLASIQVPDDECVRNGFGKRRSTAACIPAIEQQNAPSLLDQVERNDLHFRSGKRVVKRRVEYSGGDKDGGLNVDENGSGKRTRESVIKIAKGNEKLLEEIELDARQVLDSVINNAVGSMRGGIESGEMTELGVIVDEKLEENQCVFGSGESTGRTRCGRGKIGKRGKEAIVVDKLEENQSTNGGRVTRSKRRYGTEEKGNDKLADGTSISNDKDDLALELKFNVGDMEGDLNVDKNESGKWMRGSVIKVKGKAKLGEDVELTMGNVIDNVVRSVKGKLQNGKMSEAGVVADEKLEENQSGLESGRSRGRTRRAREGIGKRGKEAVVIDKLEENRSTNEGRVTRSKTRFSTEERGKGKLVDAASISNDKGDMELELDFDLESLVKGLVDSLGNRVAVEDGRQPSKKTKTKMNETRMEQFRDIARENASRFARFDRQEPEEEQLSPHVDVEIPSAGENQEIEDWPGPFSTAMKIIRDREKKLNSQHGTCISDKPESVSIPWIPKKSSGSKCRRVSIPSLQELCMRIVINNCDAVTSLEHVPDALRHRLCQLLCDCRKMNSHFLNLLVRGSPSEIRIKDCSWLTEEEFLKCFEGCDTNKLTVLQLDQCGRCMPDYVLPATLASSLSLPALITLSLVGACRLSDLGLSLLVSSAPALRSINLSQCSLLTSSSIGTLADSLGSVLRELYIDDCQNLYPMLILPALKKLEHLEVLSLAGIQTVCDDFVREFVVARGHNMKELVLRDCEKLSDSSMKIVAETCPRLCALDLVNLRKLTDSALGYLANGCREIQTLKLRQNEFSDEAMAAFLETSGEPLKELSLNNVRKVGHNTALSLARRSRNLISLDLSWCRNLTDEAVGLIVDSCLTLRVLKLFGCAQITHVFLEGHSNPEVEIVGLKMSPVLEHLGIPDSQEFMLRYSPVPSIS